MILLIFQTSPYLFQKFLNYIHFFMFVAHDERPK